MFEGQGRHHLETGINLKASTFDRDWDVEQFFREFEDVGTIAEWPALVMLLQLRICPTDRANCYGMGPDVSHIFQALRAQFGMTDRDARDCLQGMKREPRTFLQDHANHVERLDRTSQVEGEYL